MSTQKRRYQKRRRAELEEMTRRRITESAVALHGTLGPSRTSMSAVAEHAGVRRSTLYRHFPDELSLFAACTTHWMADNPAPELEHWTAIDDPAERLRAALGELYAYYERTHGMLENIMRDEATMPNVRLTFRGFRDYVDAAVDTLLAGRPGRGRAGARVRAAVGHTVALPTWRSLVLEQGLDEEQAVELMCRFVAAASV